MTCMTCMVHKPSALIRLCQGDDRPVPGPSALEPLGRPASSAGKRLIRPASSAIRPVLPKWLVLVAPHPQWCLPAVDAELGSKHSSCDQKFVTTHPALLHWLTSVRATTTSPHWLLCILLCWFSKSPLRPLLFWSQPQLVSSTHP